MDMAPTAMPNTLTALTLTLDTYALCISGTTKCTTVLYPTTGQPPTITIHICVHAAAGTYPATGDINPIQLMLTAIQ